MEAEAEVEAAKFFEKESGRGSGEKDLEAEVEAFLEKNFQMEAEANFFFKFWMRKWKRIFLKKNFGSGIESVFKINRFQKTALWV